jgi:hypothetical protein
MARLRALTAVLLGRPTIYNVVFSERPTIYHGEKVKTFDVEFFPHSGGKRKGTTYGTAH